MNHRLRVVALASASLAMVGIGAGVVQASPGGRTAAGTVKVTYKACLTSHHKLINVTQSPEPKIACPTDTHRVKWNQRGRRGFRGLPGTPGAAGATVLNGTGAPAGSVGKPGDFYIDVSSYMIYGPKTADGWPTPGHSLQGPRGPQGQQGAAGDGGGAGQTIVVGHLNNPTDLGVACGSPSGLSIAVDCTSSPFQAEPVAGLMPVDGTVSAFRVELANPAAYDTDFEVFDMESLDSAGCTVAFDDTSCSSSDTAFIGTGDHLFVAAREIAEGNTETAPPSASFGYVITPGGTPPPVNTFSARSRAHSTWAR